MTKAPPARPHTAIRRRLLRACTRKQLERLAGLPKPWLLDDESLIMIIADHWTPKIDKMFYRMIREARIPRNLKMPPRSKWRKLLRERKPHDQ